MKFSSGRLIFASLALVLAFQVAYLEAAVLLDKNSPAAEGSASEDTDVSVRTMKGSKMSPAHQSIPSPYRRHYLKFGVLGKRFSYGYLGKRTEDSQDDFEDVLDSDRERRAGRPIYGLLG